MSNFNYSKSDLWVTALGVVATIAGAILFIYLRSAEYPELLSTDSLNDRVKSVETNRGRSFVTFEASKKYQIPRALNLHYADFPSLAAVISPEDSVFKRAFSDTVRVKHLSKEYVYVLEQTIRK